MPEFSKESNGTRWYRVVYINNTIGHAAVIALFDRAIEKSLENDIPATQEIELAVP